MDRISIIRHALGLTQHDRPYRDHYCAPASGPTRDLLETMADEGLMERGNLAGPGGNRFFHVTEAGAAMVGAVLPPE